MEKLKMFSELTHFVGCNDFEEFVKHHYGREFSFVESKECGNNTDHAYTVTEDVSDFDDREIREFKESGYTSYCMPSTLLNDLCRRGLIESGNYVISVCW